MTRNAFRIATVFFLAASLFAAGITVATCRCDSGSQLFRGAPPDRVTQSCSRNIIAGTHSRNTAHELGQCKGAGLCYGYLIPGKKFIPLLSITAHTIEIALISMTFTARIADPVYFVKPFPLYILNLSFLF